MNLFKALALLQGLYYCITGIWPLIHIQSFQWITGPKTDIWLVHTVGVLVLIIGLVLTFSFFRRKVNSEPIMLAMGCNIGFILIEIIYVTQNVIWNIYLADALFQFILFILWISALIKHKESAPS
jgi:prepilin signal peptidase PulO-like enzyme (type II secretory pathway)